MYNIILHSHLVNKITHLYIIKFYDDIIIILCALVSHNKYYMIVEQFVNREIEKGKI